MPSNRNASKAEQPGKGGKKAQPQATKAKGGRLLVSDGDNNNMPKKASLRNLPVQAAPGLPNSNDAKVTLDSWSMRMNPYYQTLDKPNEYMGVRIPDDCTIKTSTFTIVKRFAVTVTSSGVAACLIGQGQATSSDSYESYLVPNPAVSSIGVTVPNSYVLGFTNHTAATSAALFSVATDASGSPQLSLAQWNAGSDSVPDLVGQARLVSGSLSARSTVSKMNNSGIFTAAFLPKGFVHANPSYVLSTLTADLVAELPGSFQMPVSEEKGFEIKYRPIDSTCVTYCDLGLDPSTLAVTIQDLYNPGAFLWCVTGAEAGSVIQCSLTLNYEGIPRANTLVFQNAVDSAKSDPIAMAEAYNAVADAPQVSEGTDLTDSLHSSELNYSGMVHPIISNMALGRVGASAMKIHESPVRCYCDKGLGKSRVQKVSQDETMFDKLAGLVGNLATTVGPELVAGLL
jgi:hypothetical protein